MLYYNKSDMFGALNCTIPVAELTGIVNRVFKASTSFPISDLPFEFCVGV